MSESITLNPAAVLFDMDGTLIDSSPAVVAAWQLMQESYPFLDLDHILASAHGYRTTDALRKWCLIEDDEKLASEVMRFERTILSEAKKKGEAGGQGIIALPGVKELLSQLDAGKESREGKEGWAICTSSTHFYASQAIPTAGLPEPKIFVTAESVQNGKPAPDPYLLGAEKSDTTADRCVVVEDAPTGIRSGKASGAIVLATCTSHSRASLEREKPDFLVDDLSYVSAKWIDGVLYLTITQPADRPSPAPTPLQTPVASRAGSPKLRAASFGMSSLPDAASFAKKMLGGSLTRADDEETTPPQTPGASDDVHGAKGLTGIGGI